MSRCGRLPWMNTYLPQISFRLQMGDVLPLSKQYFGISFVHLTKPHSGTPMQERPQGHAVLSHLAEKLREDMILRNCQHHQPPIN